MKRAFFITISKLTKIVTKITGTGSGTALPGLLIEKYCPELFAYFAGQLEQIILITGTNGKTTTKSLISRILDESEITYVTNRSGSNMRRGLLSAFLNDSNLLGKLNSKFALFEVEEATLPQIIDLLPADILIVTNLFRDQLDAYGEVNKTREYIRAAIEKIPKAKVILNADDQLVRNLTKNLPNQSYYFALPEKYHKHFKYEEAYSGPQLSKEKNLWTAENIKTLDDLSSSFELKGHSYKLSTPGIFQIYNAMAAIVCADILSIDPDEISKAFEAFAPAFGRGESIIFRGREFKILLIKNPAGFSLSVTLLRELRNINLMLILNDKIADGRDVSWIWDAQIDDLLQIKPKLLICAGTRANDMLLRMKYLFMNSGRKSERKEIKLRKNLKNALLTAIMQTKKGDVIYVLPTYTAMNEFRKLLGRKF